jgi:hypothetical protein
MKVCNIFELKTPTSAQMNKLLVSMMPNIKEIPNILKGEMIEFIQGDMRKIKFVYDVYIKKPDLLTSETIRDIFHIKSYNEDSKKITQSLLNNPTTMKEHNRYMNETDRTIVALLWHENIVDVLSTKEPQRSYPFYLNILDNICYADYIDRITFQNQIWQFNEMSSLMKTFYNNKLYHDTFPENRNIFKPNEVRFTKVLTKYSTEYNNMLFVYNLCQELDIDKKDLVSFFQELRIFYGKDFMNQTEKMNDVEKLFEDYNISKLDIKRMYRYLDKNVKKDAAVIDEEDDDMDE